MRNRTLAGHEVTPGASQVQISVLDAPGAGGANHEYGIDATAMLHEMDPVTVRFQNGPIGEVGVNGVTQEALIEICIDRLRSFQAGPFACRENALALTKLEEAQMWLLQRTRARMARGVEGKNEK